MHGLNMSIGDTETELVGLRGRKLGNISCMNDLAPINRRSNYCARQVTARLTMVASGMEFFPAMLATRSLSSNSQSGVRVISR